MTTQHNNSRATYFVTSEHQLWVLFAFLFIALGVFNFLTDRPLLFAINAFTVCVALFNAKIRVERRVDERAEEFQPPMLTFGQHGPYEG